MAYTNFTTREISIKIIYFGCKGCGKTENIRSVFTHTSEEYKNNLIQLKTQAAAGGDLGEVFDFLPLSMGTVADFQVKLHLFTLPAHDLYPTLCDVLLRGVDGFVFVVDSSREKMPDNFAVLERTKRLFALNGYQMAGMPGALQYNKQDLDDKIPFEHLHQELNRSSYPDFSAIAPQSVGTMDTLLEVAKQTLHKIAVG